MKTLMIAFLTLASIASANAGTHKQDRRNDKARKQLIEDMRLRGSNIPAVLTANHKWTR